VGCRGDGGICGLGGVVVGWLGGGGCVMPALLCAFRRRAQKERVAAVLSYRSLSVRGEGPEGQGNSAPDRLSGVTTQPEKKNPAK